MKRKVNLSEYLPGIYDSNKTMLSIQDTNSIELTNLFSYIDDASNELYLLSAEERGLTLFENLLSIKRDLTLSFRERREVILAKLRGTGTTTKQMIKNVAESYSNGEVEVIEVNNRYIIKIKFIGTRGVPSNLEGLQRALREIIPAHLDIEYIFTYMTWTEFESYNKTIDEWNSLNLTADRLMAYRG